MQVALAQMSSQVGAVDANLARAVELGAQARGGGADLVVFPELAATGYCTASIQPHLATSGEDERLARVAGGGSAVIGFVDAPWYNAAAWWQNGRLNHILVSMPVAARR